MSFFAKRSAIHSVKDVSWRYMVKKMPRREQTGDALVQSRGEGRSNDEGGVCSGRSGGRGMSMGSLNPRWRRWEGEGGKVQYVGPGTRRTSFWMLCGFWEQSVKEVRTKQKD